MAIDNFEMIKPFIKPQEEGDFYFLEILQRSKDGHKINGNNQERLVRDFCILSPEHLDKHKDEIITLCEECDARAYIRLNRKSYEQVMKYLGYKISKNMLNGNKFRNPYRETASAIGKTFAKGEVIKWIVDIDFSDEEKSNKELRDKKVELVKEYVNKSKNNNDTRELIIGEIPTKNGLHLITYKFNKENFNKICFENFGTYGIDGVEIKGGMCSRNDSDEMHDMDSPTILYCPSDENAVNDYVEICGKKYRTVTIGEQTWLAENLDVETDSGSVKCNNESYGTLYTWDKAMEIANSIPGWHLPTREEWDELYITVGDDTTKLKSKTEWNDDGKGTDDYGFGVLPAGYCSGSSYHDVGTNARFWTSDEYNSSSAYRKYFDTCSRMDVGNNLKGYYYSVRLVKY